MKPPVAKSGPRQQTLPLVIVRTRVERFARHPSEATTLLAASALAIVGTAETRDRGSLVEVRNASARVITLDDSSVLAANPAARRIEETTSFDAAETAVRGLLGFTELDFERRKPSSLSPAATAPLFNQLRMAIPEVARAAAVRGASMISFCAGCPSNWASTATTLQVFARFSPLTGVPSDATSVLCGRLVTTPPGSGASQVVRSDWQAKRCRRGTGAAGERSRPLFSERLRAQLSDKSRETSLPAQFCARPSPPPPTRQAPECYPDGNNEDSSSAALRGHVHA